VDNVPHKLCGHALDVSLMDTSTGRDYGVAAIDDVVGSDVYSCAIEVRDISPKITQEILKLFFQNRKRSGGDDIEDMYYCDNEHRAVITFTGPEGNVMSAVITFTGPEVDVMSAVVSDSATLFSFIPPRAHWLMMIIT